MRTGTDTTYVRQLYKRHGKDYIQAKGKGWRIHVEKYTLFTLLGNLQGTKVLDLACGDGVYTQAALEHGAALVHGVDISSDMIEQANQRLDLYRQRKEAHTPPANKFDNATLPPHKHEVIRRAHFSVADCKNLEQMQAVLPHMQGSFDTVIGSWLLVYAINELELGGFAEVIAHFLKPGGRFVGVHWNPRGFTLPVDMQQFTFRVHTPCANPDNWQCGDQLNVDILDADRNKTMSIANTHHSLSCLKNQFAACNLQLSVKDAMVDPDAPPADSEGYRLLVGTNMFGYLVATPIALRTT